LADDKLVFGLERTLKLLREEKIAKVFFSSNCGEELMVDVKRLCDNVEVISKSSEEIGVICRKPFSISVIGVLA
jgi:ribosomal protein L30E